MNQENRVLVAGMRVQAGDPVVVLEDHKDESGMAHAIPFNKAVHKVEEIDGLAITGGAAGLPLTVVTSGWASCYSPTPLARGFKIAGSKLVVASCDPVEIKGREFYRVAVAVNGPDPLDLEDEAEGGDNE